MIDNPLFQSLILIGFGFFLGIVLTLIYIFAMSKNTVMKILLLLASKFQNTDLSFEEFWDIITKSIDKLIEVKQDEEKKRKFSNQIKGTDGKVD